MNGLMKMVTWVGFMAPNGEAGELPKGKQWIKYQELLKALKQILFPEDIWLWPITLGNWIQMALPPCHAFFQFYVAEDHLSCQLYQRSADAFLGVPFNIASYSLLTLMMAQVCNLKPGFFIHSFGDVHIYHNHFEQVKIQLSRKPYPFPKMKIKPSTSIFNYRYEDFELLDYQYHQAIKGVVAI